MKLTNEFEVPVPVEEAWPLLLDVERIIPCMPGAELLERIGDSAYKGRVSVQLGPVLLTFEGVAKFVDIDQAARRARVEAQGTDKKGRGGAHATVVFALMPAGSSSRVVIDTDLQLSGSVAQYGRASGLITSIAKELVGQFAEAFDLLARFRIPAAAEVGRIAGEHRHGRVFAGRTYRLEEHCRRTRAVPDQAGPGER